MRIITWLLSSRFLINYSGTCLNQSDPKFLKFPRLCFRHVLALYGALLFVLFVAHLLMILWYAHIISFTNSIVIMCVWSYKFMLNTFFIAKSFKLIRSEFTSAISSQFHDVMLNIFFNQQLKSFRPCGYFISFASSKSTYT